MAQFYVARRVELLGVASLLEGDMEEYDKYVNELAVPVHTRCGISDVNRESVLRIQANWKRIKDSKKESDFCE